MITWALLWSQRQNSLHVEPFEETLSKNRQAYRDDKAGDFRVMFVGTLFDVEATADSIRNTVRERTLKRGEVV